MGRSGREGLTASVNADMVRAWGTLATVVRCVNQRVIRETQGRRGRKTDPAWANRRRLLTGHERLRPDSSAKMWNSLIDTGDAGVQILQA
jgi:transposase